MRDLSDETRPSLLAARPKSRPRGRGRPLLLVATALGVLLAAAIGVRYATPVPATAYRVAVADVAIEVRGPGVLDADRHTVLSTTAQGRLQDVHVAPGDFVSAGAALVELENETQRLDLAIARHQAESALRRLDEAQAQRRRDEALLIRATRELERQQTLSGRGVASDGALDLAEADHRAAEAAVAEADARLRRLTADRRAADRTVALKETALQETQITAPFDGVVTRQHRAQGDVAAPGEPLVELVDPSSLVLGVRLDESQMAAIAREQRATVTFVSERDRAYAARVVRIGRQVDDETREFTVDLALDALPRNWALGQRGMATLHVGAATDAIAVPTEFVMRRDGAHGVWALRDGRAFWRPVTLGRASGDAVLIEAGLASGDVLLKGERLSKGLRVEIGR